MKGDFQPAVKWSGSKRPTASVITELFPSKYDTYYEPFVGGGSILYKENPEKAIASDVCEPLINLWKAIRDNPNAVISGYETRWWEFKSDTDSYYDVRDRFNRNKDPIDFLFLTRTCVNGLIRFNSDGEFNSPVHHNRDGIEPKRLQQILREWSDRIQNVEFICGDYGNVLEGVSNNDFVYLDPPYFGSSGNMYFGEIDYDRFVDICKMMDSKGCKYAISLDGERGDEVMGRELSESIYEDRRLIETDASPYSRVINGDDVNVKESLYLNYDVDEETVDYANALSW